MWDDNNRYAMRVRQKSHVFLDSKWARVQAYSEDTLLDTVSPRLDQRETRGGIETRMDIREALQRGDVEDAITRVNDSNLEVCRYFAM
jgi:hypothetical protein